MIHDRDGIQYEIKTASVDDGFTATWTCKKCRKSGTVINAYKTRDEAALAARARLFSDHHFKGHQRSMARTV